MSDPIENGNNRNGKGQFVEGNKASVGKGRPKGSMSIPDMLRRIGEESVPVELQLKVKRLFDEVETDKMTLMEAVMRTTMMYAIQGKPWAVQFIADRTEGKPQQTINVESHKPIQLIKTGIESFDNA
jgi:hypothetical protein